MTEFAIVIPARYASQRLPGKPLLRIAGKPMLRHVWERAVESPASEVIIATDDERIAKAAEEFGAVVCMTSPEHASGTDRIAEVADICDWPDDNIVVNLQGDEPLMPPVLPGECARLLDDDTADIGTLASPLSVPADRDDPNVVKVIVDSTGRAMYFSRAAIPYSRSEDTEELAGRTALQHHGIYAYRCGVLRRLVDSPPAAIEHCEKLEQLRAMYLGMHIRVAVPSVRPGPGVDTRNDIDDVEAMLRATE